MAKTKTKAKINQPKKVKGGSVLGKEGEVWFALKCSNFNKTECRSFKAYIASVCKDFFDDPDDPDDDVKEEE